MQPNEYEESVSSARGKSVKRGKAQDYGRRLRLVCATFPILGSNNLVELKRSPEKRVLGGKWIFFLSEHAKSEDVGAKDVDTLQTLRRGVNEELNHRFRWSFYDPQDVIDMSYQGDSEKYFWSASLFVIPVRSVRQLRPDGREILDLRVRNIDRVFEEARSRDSVYSGFKPNSFIERLEGHTRKALELPKYSRR